AESADELIPWLQENQEVLRRMLTNMAVVEATGIAYGARVRSPAPTESLAAIDALLGAPSRGELDRLRSALTTLAPRPVVAGFYKPGASGALGQFVMHLREDGLSYEEIATILGELKPREEHASEEKYQLHRTSVVDAVKHRINGEKRKLRRSYGSSAVLGGDDGAENLPRQERWVVLVSAGGQASSPVTISI
ncbi:MAG: hypothetical protein JWN04_1094, partial [Myxococcaceae bacterium]|nr:hypothetical protein [Myxococcaceae bacterium]